MSKQYKQFDEKDLPGLPKWPGVYVTGKSVTPEQAKEIIMRTDRSVFSISSYGLGNNHRFADMVRRESGWQPFIDADERLNKIRWDKATTPDQLVSACVECERKFGEFRNFWQLSSAWSHAMNHVNTQYVYNDWMASSYIFGPTGWCHPDGSILVDGHNYGKWPDVKEIMDDWAILLKEFPYLDLQCTLFNAEAMDDNPEPVVTILVKDGEVIACEPDLSLHCERPSPAGQHGRKVEDMVAAFQFGRSENGWPIEWVQEFCAKSAALLNDMMAHPEKYTKTEEQE